MTYEPPQVRSGRDRILAGERLPEETRPTRRYFCRGCGAQETSMLVPRGWYVLTRASGSIDTKSTRLGLYCDVRCLLAQGERLTGIEDDLGDEFDRAPSEFRHRSSSPRPW